MHTDYFMSVNELRHEWELMLKARLNSDKLETVCWCMCVCEKERERELACVHACVCTVV